ncbi:magnesium chelatase subunit H [Acidiphilium sp.]|uniref:magnesium chelatase subunit H n=1 Tax=Acidiphilium sp. TaxID=527 RepID=UPI003D066A51
MQKPISPADNATPIRVAIVTMDSHLDGVIEAGRKSLIEEYPGLSIELHTADHWASSKTALAACTAAIGSADIVIATMLFLDEHIRLVQPALAARRDHCDAMLCALSAAEVVNLTRLGRLDMSKEGSAALKFLKNLRPKRKDSSAAESQMRTLRRLPKMLKLIPGAAQDLRSYFLALSYWLAGSSDNVESLMRMLIRRYASGPRGVLKSKVAAPAPREYTEVGVYHPRMPGHIGTDRAAVPRCAHAHGTVGLVLLRSLIISNDCAHYDGVIAAIEAAGYQVLPVFAAGLDARPAMERYFVKDGIPTVDAIVSLTGFSLVGGPAYNDSKAAEAVLAALDVPYLSAHALEFQPISTWEADPRGLTPIEATMMVALPELDGGIVPMTFGGRIGGSGPTARAMTVHAERATMLANRVARLIRLRKAARAERRIGLVIFNFPPNAGATGTAAYLSVFRSLYNTLGALRDAGYTVEMPADVETLREMICVGNAAQYGAPANVAVKIPRDDHVRREPHLAEIEKIWGPAPGRQNSDGASIFIVGVQLGNVFIGVQPAFGFEGDPMRLMFEGGFAPTHAFSAFYRWLREDFAAHAVLHFGTHGALEFMPGKQAGMTGKCWPDRLIGDLPNFYLYASNNPSEGMLAKRRANATLISHLTPPVTQAGLYRGLADLKANVLHWRGLPPETQACERHDLEALIQAEAAKLDLAAAEPAWGETAAAAIAQLNIALLDLEYSLIPMGLHVVGNPLDATQRRELLDAAGITEPRERARIDALLGTDHEIPAIIKALDGRYIRPTPGGDILRNTDVLPTGRNIYGFDPFRMPSPYAVSDGARQADRLIARHHAESGALPETVAMVLWGSDNLKSEGGPIAQALWLMGARPRRDSYGRLAGAELIPIAELGRPRIDVVITLSGIFRDLLPLQTKLLAEAALLAAEIDEPFSQNFIRKHTQDFIAQHGGSIEDAALRVFSNGDGTYGANVNQLVDSGAWQNEDELGNAFVKRKGFAYGVAGRAERHDAVFGAILKTVDVAYQNLESLDLGVTTIDHYFDGLGGMSRAVKAARGTDACLYIGDQTTSDGTIRTLSEQVSIETRTRMLNPKYFEAMLSHGSEGVRNIEASVTNTLGWSATTGQVEPWIYREISNVFVLDPEMRDRIAKLNPIASAKIAGRLLEAHERNYWTPDDATLEALRAAGAELEDRLEGLEMERAA